MVHGNLVLVLTLPPVIDVLHQQLLIGRKHRRIAILGQDQHRHVVLLGIDMQAMNMQVDLVEPMRDVHFAMSPVGQLVGRFLGVEVVLEIFQPRVVAHIQEIVQSNP